MSGEKSTTERLASLEVWADARSKEIQRLKGSVSTLQKDNFDMRTDMAVLTEENENLKKMNESLTEKVHSLERRVTDSFGEATPRSSADVRKLESLETTVTRLVHDIPVMQANKQKIKKLARKFKGMGKTVKQLSTLRKVLGRTMMSARGGPSQQVDAKVDALETRTLAIEGKLGDVHQSVTSVQVDTRDDKLVTHQSVPLDERVDDDDIDGLWDAGGRRVVVRRGGRYGVGGRWVQRGAGVVNVIVEWAGSRSGGRDLGRTRDDWDTACGMTVVELEEGDGVLLEAYRVEGGARIWGCEMFCWLL